DTDTLTFYVRYFITDPARDASVSDATDWTDSTHTIVVTPVTDPVSLTINGTGSPENPTIDVTTGDFTVDVIVAKVPDNNANDAADYDGSEQFTQIIVSGVPNGMLLKGVTLGKGEDAVSFPLSDGGE